MGQKDGTRLIFTSFLDAETGNENGSRSKLRTEAFEKSLKSDQD